MPKKKKKSVRERKAKQPRNWAAVEAWKKKAGPMKDKRRRIKHKGKTDEAS